MKLTIGLGFNGKYSNLHWETVPLTWLKPHFPNSHFEMFPLGAYFSTSIVTLNLKLSSVHVCSVVISQYRKWTYNQIYHKNGPEYTITDIYMYTYTNILQSWKLYEELGEQNMYPICERNDRGKSIKPPPLSRLLFSKRNRKDVII